MAAFWNFLASLQGPAITFFFGLLALVLGALFNAHLNRERDDRQRREEMKAVAAALYGEILLLRPKIAFLGKLVAKTYWAEGFERRPHLRFDETLLERDNLGDPVIYRALASKLGMLPPDVVLAITKFHADYEAVRDWLPKLVPNEKRGFTYSVVSLLEPARDAALDVKPALRAIEKLLDIKTPASDPDLRDVHMVIAHEEETVAELEEMQKL